MASDVSKKSVLLISKGHLNNSPHLPVDCGTLSIHCLTPERIIVGCENGCYISHIDVGHHDSIEELSQFRNNEVSSITSNCDDNPNTVFIASDTKIYLFDFRLSFKNHVECYSENTDEINEIEWNDETGQLVACDDSGESKIYDIKTNKLFRTLRRKHSNICSTVSFVPKRLDNVITGGLDSQIIVWDYKRVKPLQFVNTQSILKQMGDDSVYMFNPPLVHSIDTCSSGNMLACGLGNGTLQMFNVLKGKTMLAPSLLINRHSTLGISSVHFLQDNINNSSMLASGGNDGIINVWSFPVTKQEKKKQTISVNSVCTEEEISDFLVGDYDVHSKINSIESTIVNDKTLLFVADQNSYVKILEINDA